MVVNSRLTHFGTLFCPTMWRCWYSLLTEKETVMPFQNLFPDNRSVEYAECFEQRRGVSTYRLTHDLPGRLTSRSQCKTYGDT